MTAHHIQTPSSGRPTPISLPVNPCAPGAKRIVLPPMPRRPLTRTDREFFRALRAAEMAVWEAASRRSASTTEEPGAAAA